MADYANDPKLDFAVFKNKYAKTDRHPSEVGKIEFTREFLKAMVERAKTGTMPVLRAAMWDRTSKAGLDYRFSGFHTTCLNAPNHTLIEKIAASHSM